MSQTLTFDRIPSPVGELLIVVDDAGRLRMLEFAGRDERTSASLRRGCGDAKAPLSPGRAPAAVRDPIEAYFAGEIGALSAIQTQAAGTPFQQKVWTALREIPPGETASYGDIARQIGQPTAVRAVGLANGANPIALVVPCHRVIGADRSLTGYAGGLERKRWLLEHEGVRLPERRRQAPAAALLP